MNAREYTFDSLLFGAGKPGFRCPSLCYLVSLTDSTSHGIAKTLPAKRILTWLYGVEEQALNVDELRAGEEFFNRYFPGGFYPQTPCMVVKEWSPISAMLENGMEPLVLNREAKFRAFATGIWEPQRFSSEIEIESATTDEALFWAILQQVSRKAHERRMWVSVIAAPGWDYDAAIGSLPPWPAEEVERSGRILWKRTRRG